MNNRNTMITRLSSLMLPVLAVALFCVAPLAHAQFDGGDFGGSVDSSCCSDTGYYDTGSGYTPSYDTGYYDTGSGYTPSYDTGYYDTASGYTPTDTGWYDTASGYTPTSDYFASGYPVSGYMGGSGFFGGGFSGGWGVPFSGGAPSISNTNTNVNTNVNSCTNGSCNTAINAPTTVTVTNPPTVVVNNPQTPVYPPVYNPPVIYPNPVPACTTCGCPGYGVCPIAYNNTPYVTLSQVPYTGLDLGFWGTIAYWSFLVLWALAAAYLIVVKKVQNRIVRSVKNFLFGTKETVLAHETSSSLDINALASQIAAILNPMVATSNSAPVRAPQGDYTDEFILSQINRKRS